MLFLLLSLSISSKAQHHSSELQFVPVPTMIEQEQNSTNFPDPHAVLKRSLIIPGWGQITNKQAWKVPIVYGLLGGLTYYSIDLTKKYHDYRAAFYNQYTSNEDMKFGPTPAYLEGASQSSLRSNRNFLRNRRDFIYVTIALAYMLNAVDAYVFAHLRSFDVSDDLSFQGNLGTTTLASLNHTTVPTISLRFSF